MSARSLPATQFATPCRFHGCKRLIHLPVLSDNGTQCLASADEVWVKSDVYFDRTLYALPFVLFRDFVSSVHARYQTRSDRVKLTGIRYRISVIHDRPRRRFHPSF